MRSSVSVSSPIVAGFVGVLWVIGGVGGGGSTPGDEAARGLFSSDPVNPVIGDESFLVTFGRLPTDAGSEPRYQWLVGGEAAAGDTLFGGIFYRAGARLGAIPLSSWRYHGWRPNAIVTLGGRVDGVQGVVPAALTIPGGLLFAFDTIDTRYAYEDFHELVPWLIVQLRAEGAWVARGRPHEIDWTGGLDLVWRVNRWTDMTRENFRPRDLIASVTVTKFAGTIYGGVAVGLGCWSHTTQLMTDIGPVTVSPPLGPYW